jgi:hypothetical protein
MSGAEPAKTHYQRNRQRGPIGAAPPAAGNSSSSYRSRRKLTSANNDADDTGDKIYRRTPLGYGRDD